MINLQLGVNYSWGDVQLLIAGAFPIIGIDAISYDEEQDIEGNFGAGNFYVGVGFGAVKYKGSISLYQEEIENLKEIAPNGRIQEIVPFSIKVVRGNNTQALVVDTLQNCIIKNTPFDTKQGDKKIVNKLELFIGQIIWG